MVEQKETTMKTSIEVKCFPGFYGSIFSEDHILENWIDRMQYEYPELEHLADFELPDSYRSNVAKEFAKMYISELNDKLGLNMKLLSESVNSPREYNFYNDQVICEIEVDDWDSFINRIYSLMDEPEIRVELAKIIKQNHSNRSGFWSFMSNEIEVWYGMLQDPCSTTYLECVLWYLYCLKTGEHADGDGEWGMAEWIYEIQGCNTDVMEPVPATPEAKAEWDEWLEKQHQLEVIRNMPVLPGLESI